MSESSDKTEGGAPAAAAPATSNKSKVTAEASVPISAVTALMSQMERMMGLVADRLAVLPSAAPQPILSGNDREAVLLRRLQDAEDMVNNLRQNQGLPGKINKMDYAAGVKKFQDDERAVRFKNATGKRVFFCRVSDLHQVVSGRLIATDFEADEQTLMRLIKTQYEELIGSRGSMASDSKTSVVMEPVDPEKVRQAMAIRVGEVETKAAQKMMEKDAELGLFVAILG